MSNGNSAEELKLLGNDAFAAKDFQKAISFYSQAIKLEPTNHLLYSNRSTTYGNMGEWKKAEEDAKECIRLDPSFVKGYYRLATAQIEGKDLDAAMATIRHGLTIEANNPQLTKQLRMVQQQKKVAAARQHQQPPVSLPIGSSMDAVTAQELQELQIHHRQTTRELSTVQANLIKTQREYKIAELTSNELLKSVPPETQCYKSVGKMFVRTTRNDMVDHLQKKMENNTKKEQEMGQKVEYLDRQLKSQQQNIQELVASSNPSGGAMATSE